MLKGYLLTVAGLICFFEGLPYLANPERMQRWMEKISRMPASRLRLFGAILMGLGLALVYWGQRHGG